MLYYILKFLISTLIIVLILEITKCHNGIAALVASLPLTSLLAIILMHVEGSDSLQIAALSKQIFWLVLPSLLFFLMLPLLIKQGLSLGLSIAPTAGRYFMLLPLLRRMGVQL